MKYKSIIFWIFGVTFLLSLLTLFIPEIYRKFQFQPNWINAKSKQFSKLLKKFPFHNKNSFMGATQKFCRNYNERLNPNYFYYYNGTSISPNKSIGEKGLLWCKIPKSGSTTLTKLFLRLAGVHLPVDEDDDSTPSTKRPNYSKHNLTRVHKLLRDFYPRIPYGTLKNLFKSRDVVSFLVVRNPFERLVSAYRDKLESYERDLRFRDGYYHERYGRYMISSKETNGSSTLRKVPTWSEFVTYLLKTPVSKFDEHWMPMNRICSPCAYKYNHVVRLESFQSQIQIPLQHARIYTPNLGWSHGMRHGKTITAKYFKNLTLSEIKRLYVKYRRDFQLFGYKPHKFYRLHSISGHKV